MARRARGINVFEADETALLEDRILSRLHSLSEREAGVIRLRYGFVDGNPRTLDEIAQVYGVTSERIRQILKRTLTKLQLDLSA